MFESHERLERPQGPVVLVVMDGVGVGLSDEYDAVAMAHTPTLDLHTLVEP